MCSRKINIIIYGDDMGYATGGYGGGSYVQGGGYPMG